MKTILVLLLSAFAFGIANAQPYPSKPISFVVGFSPGGGTDTTARLIAPILAESLGQPVLIENRPGGAANIAAEYVSRAAPDGYTILLYVDAYTIAPSLFSNLRYDPVKSFVPITNLVSGAHVLAGNPSAPASTLRELVEYAKQNPGKLSYGTPGVGQPQHLAMELVKTISGGLQITHIPYKGGSLALQDALSGQIPLTMQGVAILLPHIKAGKLKAFAVTSKTRQALLPDVPTFRELGYENFETVQWWGPAVPAGTPTAIVQRLHEEFVKALRNPALVERYSKIGLEATPSASPEAFSSFIETEIRRWKPVVAAAGAKITD